MYILYRTKSFVKSLKIISQNKKFKSEALKVVLELLQKGENLPVKYQDHALKGEFLGVRECHVGNDMLLMYQKKDDALVLILLDIGTHSELFR